MYLLIQVSKLMASFIRQLPKQFRLMVAKCDIACGATRVLKNRGDVKSDDARLHLFDLRKEVLIALSATLGVYAKTTGSVGDEFAAAAELLAHQMYLSVKQKLTLSLLKVYSDNRYL